MTKPGIAVWSLGGHARRNLVPAALASRWRLVGVCSRAAAVVASVAAETGCRVYRDPNEMLTDPDVAAVLIAGPNGVHYRHSRKALDAGKAVLVEKSFAATEEEARELADLGAARGLLVVECFGYLFHPQFAELDRLAHDTALTGKVASITSEFGFPHRASDDIRYRSDLAGGALLDAGAYCLSAVSRLGSGTPKVAWARFSRADNYDVDVGGQAILTFKDGLTGICDWGFGRAYRNRVSLWGANAALVTDRIFARPADLATEIRIIHQVDHRPETVTVAPANAFVAMLNRLAGDLYDAEAQCRHRDDILRQAALLRAVREAAR